MKYEQEQDGWCGPASLQYALHALGKEMSQELIAKKTGTTIKNGVDPIGIERFIKSIGYKPLVFSNKEPLKTLQTLNEGIKNNKQAIIDFIDGDSLEKDGHYSVFEGMNKGNVKLWDPSGGKNRSIQLDDFITHWKDKTINGKLFKYWAILF